MKVYSLFTLRIRFKKKFPSMLPTTRIFHPIINFKHIIYSPASKVFVGFYIQTAQIYTIVSIKFNWLRFYACMFLPSKTTTYSSQHTHTHTIFQFFLMRNVKKNILGSDNRFSLNSACVYVLNKKKTIVDHPIGKFIFIFGP